MSTSIASVPAARSLEHFSATRVGDEVVLYDDSTMAYHTLNAPAFAVWQLCDGSRDVPAIVDALIRAGTAATPETVDLAIAELGEAGLLVSESERWNPGLTRRRVVKLAAAGALGAAVLPAISSVTAPVAANLTTCTPGANLDDNDPCNCSAECDNGCCCRNPLDAPTGVCRPHVGGTCSIPGGGPQIPSTCLP